MVDYRCPWCKWDGDYQHSTGYSPDGVIMKDNRDYCQNCLLKMTYNLLLKANGNN